MVDVMPEVVTKTRMGTLRDDLFNMATVRFCRLGLFAFVLFMMLYFMVKKYLLRPNLANITAGKSLE
jgi:putative flippase GtrA